MKKTFGEYYLGLDIGTESVGWAVTNLDYQLQKLNGKSLWGIRLFEAGKTAAERRVFRASRRRLQRRKQRMSLLQSFFAEEISKVDPGFFQRLTESRYLPEDKSFDSPCSLFSDKNFADKDYHKTFPTIYHLRNALISSEDKFDVRLVYLALHNILKHRGHFLFEGQEMENISKFSEVFFQMQRTLNEELEIDMDCTSLSEVEEILSSRRMSRTEKKKRLYCLFSCDDKTPESKHKQAFINLFIGSPV